VVNFSAAGAPLKIIAAAICLAVLSGCGERELSACISSAEQLVLLRQMTVVGGKKISFDLCIKNNMGEKYCRAVWLDADSEVRGCMERHGFKFAEAPSGPYCHFMNYDDVYCYISKWALLLPNELQKMFVPQRP
jgi:hypothetical protein